MSTISPECGPDRAADIDAQSKQSYWPIILLSVFGLLISLERWHTFNEPLERDAAGYAVIGHEMLRGRQLYSDLWERKPPLLYAMFSAAETLVGYGRAEIFLLTVSTSILTMLGRYFAGSRLCPEQRQIQTGLFAAGLWTILGGDLYAQANQPNTEVFINVAIIWALVILISMSATDQSMNGPTKRRWGWSLLLGSLFAAATLYKHNAIFMAGGLCVGYVINPFAKKQYGKRAAEMAVAVGVVGICWGSMVAYFAHAGRLGAFINVLFKENLDYAGSIWRNCLRIAQPFVLKAIFVRWGLAPAALVGIWLICLIWRRAWSQFGGCWDILFAGTVGAWLTIASPGRFFPHYYQLVMPFLCLAAAGAASGLLSRQLRINSALAIAMIIVMFGISIIREGSYYLLPADEWTARKKVGPFVEQYVMADR